MDLIKIIMTKMQNHIYTDNLHGRFYLNFKVKFSHIMKEINHSRFFKGCQTNLNQ